ncbi:MAG: hypothetical protein HYZ14_12075 [Bacteroidetes bacterium]|nr:hypothetical protein [Bacteroidota bacterium]
MNLPVFIPLTAITLLIICCSSLTTDREYKTIDFKAFQLTTPGNWNEFQFQGIDSYVGGITNGDDSLIFDYGQYSYDFVHESPDQYYFSTDTVNGKKAKTLRPKIPGEGMLGIYIESAYNGNHFSLAGSQIKEEEPVLAIFRTIRFPDSDTTLNSLNFARNFEAAENQKEAESVFKRNCASCHYQSDKLMIGPGFSTISKQRFDLWFSDSTFDFVSTGNFSKQYGPEYHRTFLKTLPETELVLLRQLFKE